MIDALTLVCNKILTTGEWSTGWTRSFDTVPAGVSNLQNHQPYKSSKQSHDGCIEGPGSTTIK